MKHRHLVDGVGYTFVSIEDILDRGSPVDWVELRNAVRAAPFGNVAQMVFEVSKATQIYGTSNLWRKYVEAVRREHERDREAQNESPPT